MKKPSQTSKPSTNKPASRSSKLTSIAVSGYKSIATEQSITIKPLTLLAGTNSSGKSSLIQPLLLLKQTLESSFDPGPLLLNGNNVRFTSADQLLTHTAKKRATEFTIKLNNDTQDQLSLTFIKQPNQGLQIKEMTFKTDQDKTTLRPNQSGQSLFTALPNEAQARFQDFKKILGSSPKLAELSKLAELRVVRNKCFLELRTISPKENLPIAMFLTPTDPFKAAISGLIHLPGLRGNPERTYPVTAVGSRFPGTFEKYTASIIAQWEEQSNSEALNAASRDLEHLGLTWRVRATRLDDTQVEIQVGRTRQSSRNAKHDLISIADVGFGVSQTLPIIVALHAAKEGQLVYLEQPEIHLHPRAQAAMAEVLANAAKRGVTTIVETHSSLLLLGVQTLIAEGRLPADSVALHWFTRTKDGTTKVTSAEPDENGAFGNWPEDFDRTMLDAQDRYLSAIEQKLSQS